MNDTTALRRITKRRARSDVEWRAEIRRLRAQGLSLRVIAEAAGVSHVAVLKILRGK